MVETRAHGPLPAVLILLTVLTGLVDAFSYLQLGQVFVANMTGNIILLGFGVGGSGGVLGSALAAVFFCAGAFAGGRLVFRRRSHRGELLGKAVALQAGSLVVAALIATQYGHADGFERKVLIAVLAGGMGWQFAIVRRLGVPDIRTVVVTSTITALVADSAQSRGQIVRRVLSITALLAGAAAGALLIDGVSAQAPLWAASGAAVLAALGGFAASRRPGAARWG